MRTHLDLGVIREGDVETEVGSQGVVREKAQTLIMKIVTFKTIEEEVGVKEVEEEIVVECRTIGTTRLKRKMTKQETDSHNLVTEPGKLQD